MVDGLQGPKGGGGDVPHGNGGPAKTCLTVMEVPHIRPARSEDDKKGVDRALARGASMGDGCVNRFVPGFPFN